jgi:hypothetical protein
MRKLSLIFVGVSFTILAIIVACEKDLLPNSKSLTVSEAKEWVESNYPEFIPLKFGNDERKPFIIKPKWSMSGRSSKGKWEFVETLIEAEGKFGFATPSSFEKWKNSENYGYLNSLSRLVVLKDTESKQMYSFIMTIVADMEYLEQSKFELWKDSYLKMSKDFNGLVLYHDLTGKFVNGWRFDNGKPDRTVTFDSGGDLPIRVKTTITTCETYAITQYYQNCMTWTQNGENYSYCNPTVYSTTTYYTVCTTTEVPDTPGGGYTPPTVPPFTGGTPCAGDPINNPRIASSGGTGICGGIYGCYRPGSHPQCDNVKGFHDGIDIYAPLDSPVYAMYSGTVAIDQSGVPANTYGTAGALGNSVRITSTPSSTTGLANPISIAYSHLNSISVTNGQWVQAGVQIGTTGSTGNAWNYYETPGAEPHVHIQVYPALSNGTLGTKIDPMPYLATKFGSDANVLIPCIR